MADENLHRQPERVVRRTQVQTDWRGKGFTEPRAFAAEGMRVAIVSCLRCGAVVLLDPADDEDTLAIHNASHRALAGEDDSGELTADEIRDMK